MTDDDTVEDSPLQTPNDSLLRHFASLGPLHGALSEFSEQGRRAAHEAHRFFAGLIPPRLRAFTQRLWRFLLAGFHAPPKIAHHKLQETRSHPVVHKETFREGKDDAISTHKDPSSAAGQ